MNLMYNQTMKYWYKRRRYGWGWAPVTWQGWSVVVACLGAIIVAAMVLLGDEPHNTWTADSWTFLGVAAIILCILLASGYARGPRPKWRWGTSPSDNPDEDF